MKRAELPADLDKLDTWLEAERQVCFELIERDGRPAPRDLPKIWREWWTLRQAFGIPRWNALLGESFVAEHADDGGGGPDFILTLASGEPLSLEVTEATTEEDRLAIKKGRRADKPCMVGELGGRGEAGWMGDRPEREVAADINQAIRRKEGRSYEGPVALLIYVNSNPGSVIHDIYRLGACLKPLGGSAPFEFALVVGGAGAGSAICLRRTSVSVVDSSGNTTISV